VNIPGKSIFYVSCGIALTAIAVFIFGIANSTSFAPLDLSGRLVRAEARRKTYSFSIDSELGRVMVLDITTGSEFLRIITMPNGTTIAASAGSISGTRNKCVNSLLISTKEQARTNKGAFGV
jgi:hypothetical protein